MIFKKPKTKTKIFQSTKSPHFPPRGKGSQLRMRKRVLCWSIYNILLVYIGRYTY